MGYLGRTPTPSPVTADDIPDNSIDASKIIDGSIELAEIADNSITDAKLNSSKLDGIETGATADQSKADIEGLGLSYLHSGNIGSTDLNNLTTVGVYCNANTSANQPIDNNAGSIIHLKGLDGNYVSQLFQYSSGGDLYVRGKHGSAAAWSSWSKVWHDGNTAGTVLQVVSSIFTTSFSHSNTALTDVGHSVSITPKSATSTLYLEWAGNISTNTIQGMVVAIREGNTSIGGGSQSGGGVFNYNADYIGNTHDNQSMITLTPSTGLAARTFKISTKISHGSGTNGAKYEGGWGPCMLKITEIA